MIIIIIDNNKGTSYPANLLFSWKIIHENRISHENGGQKNTSLGWFYKINIGFNPIFKIDSNFELRKSTLLFGDSGVGKTLIAQWLQTLCIGDIAHNRLTCEKMILSDFSLKYFTDSENKARIQIENNIITRHVNDIIIPIPFFDIRVIYIPFIHPSYDESNLDYVSKRINIPKHIIKQLESEINRTEFKCSKGHISFENENIILSSYYNRELSSITFNGLSSGERDAICIEIVCAYARQIAMRVPTLLILDIDGASLDTQMKKQSAQLLSKQTFQTLILSNSNWDISEKELIKEWCSYEIRKHDTGNEIIPIFK